MAIVTKVAMVVMVIMVVITAMVAAIMDIMAIRTVVATKAIITAMNTMIAIDYIYSYIHVLIILRGDIVFSLYLLLIHTLRQTVIIDKSKEKD